MILQPTDSSIQLAAKALEEGLLIGLPTETVYGIAANAFNESAINSIYSLKRRPKNNPLIVHLASIDMAKNLALKWPAEYSYLAQAFWPGPLTLIAPKSDQVPQSVTGENPTVALRMPNHQVALKLLKILDFPLAAPSANRFMGLSPTSASDIEEDISAGLACILDGGPCEIGIESTVVKLENNQIVILRPGRISSADIQSVLPNISVREAHATIDSHESPGQYPRHYAPQATLILVNKIAEEAIGLTFQPTSNPGQIKMPNEPHAYAQALYHALKSLDRPEIENIEVECPPDDSSWDAIWDRLKKASTQDGSIEKRSTS